MSGHKCPDYESQQQLIQSLLSPTCYDHVVDNIHIIETHISWVILTGHYVYKIKKALDLGFLDYSTLERRHHFCDEEIRLNSRTAPDIYIKTVAITGPLDSPRVEAAGTAVEYAVQMHMFIEHALLSNFLAEGKLSIDLLDQLSANLAQFHHSIAVARPDNPLGQASVVFHPVNENFEQIKERIAESAIIERLQVLHDWSHQTYQQLKSVMQERHDSGFIRECHGDLHLGNIAIINNEIRMFDGIEFNERLRWIDVISELAFLLMDLEARGRSDYKYYLLNQYMQLMGDYSGLVLLRFYTVYRAMVRAKVAAISLEQKPSTTSDDWKAFHNYLQLAEAQTRTDKPSLFISYGLSGSGKSYLCQHYLNRLPLLHISSDIERKRLYGLDLYASSRSAPGAGIYTAEASQLTYQRLFDLAQVILNAGYSVVVDATFLQHTWRQRFYQLAQDSGTPFRILHLQSSPSELNSRIQHRQQQDKQTSEADIEVLQRQLQNHDPLQADEQAMSLDIDTASQDSIQSALHSIEQVLHSALSNQ